MVLTRRPGISAMLAFLAAVLVAALAGPAMAQPQMPVSCTSTIGAAKAKVLVQRCLDVSPATRPPCNAANSCAMIEEEIARGCGFLGKDAPAFCPKP